MGKKLIKYGLNIAFLILIFYLTVRSVFHGVDLHATMRALQTANPLFILFGILCVICFILGESVIIHFLLRNLGTRVPFFHCCLYSFVGFFYSSITPSASGGQPMQLFYMRKDKLPVGVSTVVLAIVSITYKMVLVVVGAAVLLIRPRALIDPIRPVIPIFYFGFLLNIVFVSFLVLLVFRPGILRAAALRILRLIHRIRPFQNLEKQTGRIDNLIEQYRGTAEFFRSHRSVILRVFLLTVMQRFLQFFLTWLAYKAFGLSGHSLWVIVGLQALISVAADMLPFPGGMGISENLFLRIFLPVFGSTFVLPGMMFSRGLSYYTQLLISAIMTVAAMFFFHLRQKRTNEINRDPS